MLDSLQVLGLSRADTRKAASKLHTQAIKSMHSIVQITGVLEHSRNATYHARPKAQDKPP